MSSTWINPTDFNKSINQGLAEGSYSGANVFPISMGGTNAAVKATAFNNLSPMSSTGDLIYYGPGSTGTALPIGTTGQSLIVAAGYPVWGTPTSPILYVTETTTTFTVTQFQSNYIFLCTPTAAQTGTMPGTSVTTGMTFKFINNAAGAFPTTLITPTGSLTIAIVQPGTSVTLLLINSAAPSALASWVAY